MAVPSTEYPFHIHVDSSNVGTGCILVQQFPEGKRIVSFNSKVFDNAEQKTSTLHRELCGIVSALQTYEHYVIGSPFPIYLYCDHKPILYLGTQRTTIPSMFQIPNHHHQILQPLNHLDTWIKSRLPRYSQQTLSEANKLQLQHKEIPHVYHSMIRTVRKYATPSSTKTNKMHLTTTSTPSSAKKAIRERLSERKTMEMNIMSKTSSKIMKS